jgi:tRNA(Ile)-lysidine synthase
LNRAAPSAFDETPVSAGEARTLFVCLEGETTLLVAVSGGPDSVALLALLAKWARQPGRPILHAATVDHGLRAGAAVEAAMVARLCERLGVAHVILTWDGPMPGSGVQSRARQARYALLGGRAVELGGAVLVTAHTLDDQAETILMRMAHGSGPTGLLGMRARSRKAGTVLARPLLGVSKARLLATLRARELPFAEDPSNGDRRFERVRWRTLMPSLAAEGLNARRLATFTARLARLEQAVETRAAALFAASVLPQTVPAGLELNLAALRDEPDEILLRVLAMALVRLEGEDAGFARLGRLESCGLALATALRTGAAMTRTLSGYVLALRRDGVLCFQPERERRRGIHPASS